MWQRPKGREPMKPPSKGLSYRQFLEKLHTGVSVPSLVWKCSEP
jgi:hypothetical protein